MSKTMYCVFQEHIEKNAMPWTKVTLLGLFSDEATATQHYEKMKKEREYYHSREEDHIYMTSFETEVPIEHDLN